MPQCVIAKSPNHARAAALKLLASRDSWCVRHTPVAPLLYRGLPYLGQSASHSSSYRVPEESHVASPSHKAHTELASFSMTPRTGIEAPLLPAKLAPSQFSISLKQRAIACKAHLISEIRYRTGNEVMRRLSHSCSDLGGGEPSVIG